MNQFGFIYLKLDKRFITFKTLTINGLNRFFNYYYSLICIKYLLSHAPVIQPNEQSIYRLEIGSSGFVLNGKPGAMDFL